MYRHERIVMGLDGLLISTACFLAPSHLRPDLNWSMLVAVWMNLVFFGALGVYGIIWSFLPHRRLVELRQKYPALYSRSIYSRIFC